MRKALNENPVVQLAVLGVFAVCFAVILFTMVLRKDPVPAADPAASAAPAAAGVPAVADPAAAVGEVPAASPAPVTPEVGAGPSSKVEAGKGLPKPVVAAYEGDKAVALLVIDPAGISDRAVESYTERLAARDDVAVFTVNAKEISRYSRITQGVSVSQAPALIVVQPKKLSDGVPVASVSYGFRNAASVEVALEDALYSGPERQSFPG